MISDMVDNSNGLVSVGAGRELGHVLFSKAADRLLRHSRTAIPRLPIVPRFFPRNTN